MKWLIITLLWVVTVGATYLIARTPGAQTQPIVTHTVEHDVSAPVSLACPGVNTDELRAVVRQAIAEQKEGQRSESERAEAERAPERAAATTRASNVITAALAARHWTQSDRAALRAATATLTADELQPLLNQVTSAINSGALVVDFHSLPL
jgi:hypothetical protein